MTRPATKFGIALSVALLWGADARHKLWDLDLSKLSNHQAEMTALVWRIRFSPDERTIAVGFGPRWNFDPRPRRIALIAIDHPNIPLREFELDTKGSLHDLQWSASGAILIAQADRGPVMLRLDGKNTCNFPLHSKFAGFLSDDRMVLQSSNEIRILMPDCSLSDRWVLEDRVNVLATSPEQDLLAVELLNPLGIVELLAARNHEAKQRWAWGDLFDGFVFSESGKLVCGANSRGGKQAPDAACWDTKTGAKIAENDKVSVGQNGVASAGGDLSAITDSKFVWRQGKVWQFLDMNDDKQTPRRQLLWNVQTGKEVSSWGNVGRLKQRQLWGRDPKNLSIVETEAVLSLSPSGKYMAEGGSGLVSVYAVQP